MNMNMMVYTILFCILNGNDDDDDDDDGDQYYE